MTVAVVKNMGASVRQRLLNYGKAISRRSRKYFSITQWNAFSIGSQFHLITRSSVEGRAATDGMESPHFTPDDGH
jgi:hypothetical protein